MGGVEDEGEAPDEELEAAEVKIELHRERLPIDQRRVLVSGAGIGDAGDEAGEAGRAAAASAEPEHDAARYDALRAHGQETLEIVEIGPTHRWNREGIGHDPEQQPPAPGGARGKALTVKLEQNAPQTFSRGAVVGLASRRAAQRIASALSTALDFLSDITRPILGAIGRKRQRPAVATSGRWGRRRRSPSRSSPTNVGRSTSSPISSLIAAGGRQLHQEMPGAGCVVGGQRKDRA